MPRSRAAHLLAFFRTPSQTDHRLVLRVVFLTALVRDFWGAPQIAPKTRLQQPAVQVDRWDTPISVDLPVTSFQIRVVENCRGIFGSEIQHAVFSTNLLCAAKMILDVSDTILAAVEVKHPGQGQLFDLAAGATIPLDCVASQHLLPPCCTSNCSKQQPASNYNRPLHSCSTINGATRGPQPVGQAPHAASAFRSILSQRRFEGLAFDLFFLAIVMTGISRSKALFRVPFLVWTITIVVLGLANVEQVTAVNCALGFAHFDGSCEACAPGKYSSPFGLTCSGPCPCDSSSRIISDGPGDYGNDQTCTWLISSSSSFITLNFRSFDTENWHDYVDIYSCDSETCRERQQVARLSGSGASATSYTSSTGFMQVVFTSDDSYTRAGFEAEWSAPQGSLECSRCPAGTYAAIAAASSCLSCPAGTFQNATGATSCDPCIANAESPAGSREGSACVCKDGFYGDGIFICDPCAADASSPAGSREGSACVCKAGFYGDGIFICDPCAADASSPAGSTEGSACFCDVGFYGDGLLSCLSCLPGTYNSRLVEITEACTSSSPYAPACEVALGPFASQPQKLLVSIEISNSDFGEDDEYITAVYVGGSRIGTSYLEFGGPDDKCDKIDKIIDKHDVPVSAVSASGELRVRIETSRQVGGLRCDGYTLFALVLVRAEFNKCSRCPAGTYAAIAAASSCSNCAAGKFHNITGANSDSSCEICPAFSSSMAGSASCQCNAGYSGDAAFGCEACAPGKYSSPFGLTCSGPCPCDSSSRIISDGPGDYDYDIYHQTCTWLISSSSFITLNFRSFDLLGVGDYVDIYSCDSETCRGRGAQHVASLRSGSIANATSYTSSTGFMQVVFESVSRGKGERGGFEATFNFKSGASKALLSLTESPCLDCPAGLYTSAAGSSSCIGCTPGYFVSMKSGICEACAPAKYSSPPHLICSGPCSCNPSSRILSYYSENYNSYCHGLGYPPEDYSHGNTCTWLISASSTITLKIVNLEPSKYGCVTVESVTIYSCASEACEGGQQVARLSNSDASAVYTSSTGFMLVELKLLRFYDTPDLSIVEPSFEAEWSVQINNECVACRAGTYAPDFASSSCISCPPGTFKSSASSPGCKPCKPGTFAEAEGSIACNDCSGGKFSSGSETEPGAGSGCDDGSAPGTYGGRSHGTGGGNSNERKSRKQHPDKFRTRSNSGCEPYRDTSCSPTRVRRGPDWRSGDADGGDAVDSIGDVTGPGPEDGWCRVTWDKSGLSERYSVTSSTTDLCYATPVDDIDPYINVRGPDRCCTCAPGNQSRAGSDKCTECPAGTYSYPAMGVGACVPCATNADSSQDRSTCLCKAGYGVPLAETGDAPGTPCVDKEEQYRDKFTRTGICAYIERNNAPYSVGPPLATLCSEKVSVVPPPYSGLQGSDDGCVTLEEFTEHLEPNTDPYGWMDMDLVKLKFVEVAGSSEPSCISEEEFNEALADSAPYGWNEYGYDSDSAPYGYGYGYDSAPYFYGYDSAYGYSYGQYDYGYGSLPPLKDFFTEQIPADMCCICKDVLSADPAGDQESPTDGGSCVACPAGKYKERGGNGACELCMNKSYSTAVAAASSATCLSCGQGYTSNAGSGRESDCVLAPKPPGHITMQVVLPYAVQEFTTEVQTIFKMGIAAACRGLCECLIVKEDITIEDFFEARRRALVGRPPSTRAASRRASKGIKVDLKIAVPTDKAGRTLTTSLTKDRLNEQLAKIGVSPITEISKEAKYLESTEGGNALPVGLVVGIIIAAVVPFMGFILVVWHSYRARAPVLPEVLPEKMTEEVRKAVEKELASEQEKGEARMVGGLGEFTSGKFENSALGIKIFAGIGDKWYKPKESTTAGITAEVKRLCDCPRCAEVQADVLDAMGRKKHAERTRELAKELSDLQVAQSSDDNRETPLERDRNADCKARLEKIDAVRIELESDYGWVYGSTAGLTWKDVGPVKPIAPGFKWKEIGPDEVTKLASGRKWQKAVDTHLPKPGGTAGGDAQCPGTPADGTQATAKPIEGGQRLLNPKLVEAMKRNTTEFTQLDWDEFGITELRMDHFVEVDGVRFEPKDRGVEIKNEVLAKALQEKKENLRNLEFSTEELIALNVNGLSFSSYIKVGDKFYKPVATGGTELQNDGLATALQQKAKFSREELKDFKVSHELSYESFIKVRKQDGSDAYFKPAEAIEWPAESVQHDYGKYGQPICENCKELGLDFSTIWANLHYILHEKASEKDCFNGIRDRDRAGMVLADFLELDQFKALRDKMQLQRDKLEALLVALRLYTSHSFPAINIPLRKARKPHPLPATVICIDDGIKKLGSLADQATARIEFFRGFTDTQTSSDFRTEGGSQAAPMSTTTDYRVAVGYAIRRGKKDGSLLMKLVTTNNLERGSDLTFLSMFPGESETLFPPLTFVQPTGRTQVIECRQGTLVFKLTIVEAKTTLPQSAE